MTGFRGTPVASDRPTKEPPAGDRFPQEVAGTAARPQMRWRLRQMRSASACFQRDCARHTTLSRPGMAARTGMGTHHSRGVRRGAEPYAFRGTRRVAAGSAQNRRFLPPDGRAAPGLVAAGHHRPPSLRCHARGRFPSSAARAAGMPPYPAVPDELDQWAPNYYGGRDDSRRCARPRCARSGHPR